MLLLFLLSLMSPLGIISAADTLQQYHLLNLSETIVSAEEQFELGFFSPGESNITPNFYIGIWFKKFSNSRDRAVVWVANRHQPVLNCNTTCFLTINNDGNLVILSGKQAVPLTSIISPAKNTTATLLDTGNFILKDTNDNNLLWQSFDYPSNTFLPGMKIGFNLKTGITWSLTSWTSLTDPAPGAFTLELDPQRTMQVFIMKGSQKYWTSGSWNGRVFGSVPEMIESGVQYSFVSNANESYFTISTHNLSIVTRIVMDLSGHIKQFAWSNGTQKWILFWEQPRQQCDLYAYCGAYSKCDQSSLPYCECLEGFDAKDAKQWSVEDWSGGCVRRSGSWRCRDEENDGFVVMPNVSLPLNAKVLLGTKSAQECKLACWNNCSCIAYTYSSDDDHQCGVWYGELLNIKPADFGGGDLFLRVASSSASQVQNSRGKRRLSLILAVSIALPMLILSSILCCLWRRKLKQRGEKERNKDLLLFDFTTKTKAIKNELSNMTTVLSGGDVELPLFSLASVSAATYNFSNENKLGQGGFGPVYKGTLLNGQEVAIKRLSTGSVQGLEELKNEVTLIGRLQHRNLVRLLGCCIEGEEKILIYEYMPNKSLDLFLFDPTNRVKLNWERRIHVIEGIAHGLLYLHQYSRLRIIHRDLKASNILLDGEMNPKISDFGMARLFGGNISQANTKRIVGTYGYMSPEYAMQGLFSIKSDVFSFGILLLEILSGRKNTSFHLLESTSLNLIGHAWNLWRSERGLEFIDPILLGDSSCSSSTPIRYIHVALLCVQEKAIDRPTMSEVIAMLSSEVTRLPVPKHPAFPAGSVEGSSSIENPVVCSINDVTISSLNAR